MADANGRLAARPIGEEGYWLAVDYTGAPALLLADSRKDLPPANLEFRYLRVLFATLCELQTDAHATRGRFTLISLRTTDPDLVAHFLRVCSGVLEWLPAHPGPDQIRHVVDQLSELFRAVETPSLRSVQGLWGELLLIASATKPALLLDAWHGAAAERFDFGQGAQRVEVKTASAGSRVHHFSLDQVRSDVLKVCIVSIQVEPVGAGTSIEDLVSACHDRVATIEEHLKLDRLVGAILGRDWKAATRQRFDLALALASRRFLDARDVPAVSLPLPSGVSDVEFSADVRDVRSLDESRLTAVGGLWAAIVPQHEVLATQPLGRSAR